VPWILHDLSAAGFFPRVEDPWPQTIDLGLPFTLAGAFGVLAGVVVDEADPDKRDRAIRRGGIVGFRTGIVLYLVSLLVQLSS
jgi:hypothetical protein